MRKQLFKRVRRLLNWVAILSILIPPAIAGTTALASTEPIAIIDPIQTLEPQGTPDLAEEPIIDDGSIDAILEPAWTTPVTANTNSLAWGDFDLDGDLDLILGNEGNNPIYENIGGDLSNTITLPPCNPSDITHAVAWGDFDRDKDLDIIVGNFGSTSCVYRYNANTDTFENFWQSAVQLTSDVAWAGWDHGTGYHTYLATGNFGQISYIYVYEANSFNVHQNLGILGSTTSIAWGDYDKDGDPDLAVGNDGQANKILKNEPTGLTPVFDTLETSSTKDVAWGDMNGDGYLDLAVVNGESGGFPQADQVYCYLPATDTFEVCWTSDDESTSLSAAWGDWDGDGDLDLAVSSSTDAPTRIYRNQGTMLNPIYAWYPNPDDTAKESRAVAWADWEGDGDLELTIGYYNDVSVLLGNTAGGFSSKNFGPNNLDTRSVAWGDWDSDGDLDIALGNTTSTPNSQNNVYENTDAGFILAWSSGELDNTRSVAWGDFDGDGDLDLAVGNSAANRVYRNDGGTLSLWGGFQDSYTEDTYTVAWGDFDGDQDLDLGVGNFQGTNRIYINRGGVFTETMPLDFPNDHTKSLAWGDFDQDYDLDLLVGNDDGSNRVFINGGGGVLTQTITLPNPGGACASDDTRSVAWADWDGDGDLDIATGNAGTNGCVEILEAEYTGEIWTFSSAWQSSALDVRSVGWGDMNGDGAPDLAAGISGSPVGRNLIFRNIGGSMVQVWQAAAANADATYSVAWGDFDNDGDLDLAVGNGLNNSTYNRIYTNNWNHATNLANDPSYIEIFKPGSTDNAWHFSTHRVVGDPIILIEYELYDDEYDRAFVIEPQVSWDGGGNWEPAWEYPDQGDGTQNLAASPGGTYHVFAWDALNQLLDHQGIPFDPQGSVYVPFEQSDEEFDVTFRILVWSNNEHGGLIQRPVFGSDTTLFRIDMRPDWIDSLKWSETITVHPGTTVDFTIAVTQTDHGMPPEATIIDTLPPLGVMLIEPPTANTGELEWTTEVITWTGALPQGYQLLINYSMYVTRPLTNALELSNCANIYDGLHEPFDRCTTIVISSTPVFTESWKLVNGTSSNTAEPGDVLTYTIVLTNTGTDNAYNVVMTDVLDANLVWMDNITYTSGTASYANRMITWVGDVRVFEPVIITYTAEVVSPLPGNTEILNTFSVDDGVNPLFTFSPPVTTTILAPDLRASTKTVTPTLAQIGDVLSYTIVLSNAGYYNASPVNLTDPIPPGSSYIPGTFWSSAGLGIYDPATKAITWTGEVNIGMPVTLTFAITAGMPLLPPKPVLTNTAIAEDPMGGPIPIVATTTMWLPDLYPSFKVGTPALVELGDRIDYTIEISNAGGNGPDIELQDPIPPNAAYVPGSYQSSDGAGGYVGNAINWKGDLIHRQSVTMTFAITAGCPVSVAVPVINNTAYAYNTVDYVTPLVATTQVDIPNVAPSWIIASETSVKEGQAFFYTINIFNSGGYGPYAWMEDTLPANLEWLDDYSATSGTVTYNPATHTVRWDGELERGQSVTIYFWVRAQRMTGSNQIVNQADVSGSCGFVVLGPVTTQLWAQTFLPAVLR